MEPLQIATILTAGLSTDHLRSALPDAPIVPETVPVWIQWRATLAGALHRTADLVAPRVPACQ